MSWARRGPHLIGLPTASRQPRANQGAPPDGDEQAGSPHGRLRTGQFIPLDGSVQTSSSRWTAPNRPVHPADGDEH